MKKNNEFNNVLLKYVLEFVQNRHYGIWRTSQQFGYKIVDHAVNNPVSFVNFSIALKDINFYASGNERLEQGFLSFTDTCAQDFYRFCIKKNAHSLPIMQIMGLFLPLDTRLKILIDQPTLFLQQFLCKKEQCVTTPTNEEILHAFKLYEQIKTPDIQELLTFCENYRISFKRIETQNILNSFLNKHHLQDSAFDTYLKDISDQDLVKTCDNFLAYKFNRKILFNQCYHEGFTQKSQLENLMERVCYFYRDKDMQHVLGVDNFIVETNIAEYFLVIIDAKEKTIDHLAFLTHLIPFIAHHNKTSMSDKMFYKKVFDNWNLTQQLNSQEALTSKKMKI